jgi:hypothetical protein
MNGNHEVHEEHEEGSEDFLALCVLREVRG